MSELSALKPINGTRNAWNYFFDQVSDYQLSEVYKSRNVTLSDGNRISDSTNWLRNRNTELVKSPEKLKVVGELINKYIKINQHTENYFESLKRSINWVPEDTLGIFVRGTIFFGNLQFPLNAKVDFDNLVSEIRNFLSQSSFKNIYICTEDYRIYLKLCKVLKNYNVLASIRFDPNMTVDDWLKKQKTTNIGGLSNIGYFDTRTYLAEILLLSECNNFIGTFSNSTVFAIARNLEKGKHKSLILSDGVYTIKN